MAPTYEKSKISERVSLPVLAVLGIFAFGCPMGCASLTGSEKIPENTVNLPFMRMEHGECYYLDEFIPTPDNMVSGRNNGLFIRYYQYRSANYKSWDREALVLAFFSRDNRCWSLFDERTR